MIRINLSQAKDWRDRKIVREGYDRHRRQAAAELAFNRRPRWRTEYIPRLTFADHWGDIEDVRKGDWDEERKP